jgi:two-component system chemotaxis response regulator CheB
MKHKAIVIGVSSGGLRVLKALLTTLPEDFYFPIIIVQHIGANSENVWVEQLNSISKINIKEADEKESIKSGNVYIAPANYHLLIESGFTFSLSIDPKVNFARPSIDVLFESAAEAYKDTLIGIILTGSNNDGSKGMQRISEYGGMTIVQDPQTAESPSMPTSVLSRISPNFILTSEKILNLLIELNKRSQRL